MVTIQLDPANEQRLHELAAAKGQDVQEFTRQILEDYLEFHALSADTPEAWAETAVNLTPEVMPEETWPEGEATDGPR